MIHMQLPTDAIVKTINPLVLIYLHNYVSENNLVSGDGRVNMSWSCSHTVLNAATFEDSK